MLRKMLIGLVSFTVAMGMFLLTAQAEELQEGDYKYQVLEDGTAEITYYAGKDTEVVIPELLGGYSVTSIGEGVFNFYYELEHISIPESVITIGDAAFASCGRMTELVLPENLVSIGDGAFSACYGISNIEFPETLESIGDNAFLWCTNLSSVSIPKNVEFIGNSAFDDCTKLEYIEVAEDNPVFSSEEGVLFNKDKSVLLFYPLMKEGSTYTIPASVKTIGNSCFNNCDTLTDVVIPETVTSIEAYAFRDCDNITSITIPNSVTSISKYVFWNCAGLQELNLHENLESIGEGAFSSCKALRTIILPENIKNIAKDAFSSCESLENVYVPKSIESIANGAFSGISDNRKTFFAGSEEEWVVLDDMITNNLSESASDLYFNVFYSEEDGFLYQITGDTTAAIVQYVGTNPDVVTPTVVKKYNITAIGDYAFYENLYLNSIEISEGITDIGYLAFGYCENLSNILLPDSLKRIDGRAFVRTAITAIDLPEGLEDMELGVFTGCYNLKNIVLPEGITSVPVETFLGCRSLERVVLPEGLTHINLMSFEGCTSLKDIKFPSTLEQIDSHTFPGCTSLKSISIPSSTSIIYTSAFRGCIALEEVTFEEGIEKLCLSSFSDCTSLKKVVLPSSLKEFSYKVFENCTSLQAVEIPNTLTEIGGNAFYGCHNLTDVYYTGTEEEWRNLNIIEGNECLTNATIHFSSHMPLFKDIISTDWFYDAVAYVYKNNIMTGMNETSFAPYDILSRAQFASVLYSANNLPDVTFEAKFSDVMEYDWYADAVIWANKNGIVNGYGSGTFGPGDAVTREQMAIMMYNYAVSQGYANNQRADISTFADAGLVSWYAEEAMRWAVGAGVISGKDGGIRLDPQGSTSRAECAAIMQKFMEAQGA